MQTTNKVMTRGYAIREGLIAPSDCMDEERKYPYLRITSWYLPEEQWMVAGAVGCLSGCDCIMIVEEENVAICRSINQIRITESE